MSNSFIIDNIHQLKASIPSSVDIVLATKYATPSDVTLISSHFPTLAFGENRVQHGEKNQATGIKNPWHFIGHLQRNKAQKVIQHYQLIQSVDSLRLLTTLQGISKKSNMVTPILLQVNPMHDQAKYGFSTDDILAQIDEWSLLSNISIKGLMCMAPFDAPNIIIKKTFKQTQQLYAKLKSNGFTFSHLSMGMSNDYRIAIDEGSTMIRIGKKVFESPC